MSEQAIIATTLALRRRLESALAGSTVMLEPPSNSPPAGVGASLFLFHVLPNAELRNSLRLAAPPPEAPADRPAAPRDALPLDLRYLITVFRSGGLGPGADPSELETLGRIVQVLHEEPTLTGGALADQIVRVTPEPYPMEELSRIWGLFPGTNYATSMVYLASPVFVEVGPVPRGGPVVERHDRFGVSGDPPGLSGRRRHQLTREDA